MSPCLPAQLCEYSGSTISCSEHGICFYDLFKYVSENSTNKNLIDCICDEGYLTQNENDETKCCYKQKSQKYAILLELLPLGFGHYYSGRYLNFGIKLTFQIILLLCVLVLGVCCQAISRKKRFRGYELLSTGKHNKNDFLFDYPNRMQINTDKLIINAVALISLVLLIFWQCLDLLLFGLNIYTDENSIELKRW